LSNLQNDEKRLAELGYKQELDRSWSGFSNFAISFSIISILAGCFTTFGQAWNNGGPIAISLGWPIISLFILIIGFCMSELVSAMPTSGGIYWWASKMGGAKVGFYTGWLNLLGLFGCVASVAYGCATFFDLSFSSLSPSWAEGYSLQRVFIMFIVLLVIIAALNIGSGHLMATLNNISVWWHVFGAAFIVGVLVILPENHMSVYDMFSMRVNNTAGLAGGETSGTTFAQALSAKWAGVVLLIASFGQMFCATSALTSASRMMFAFSRDGAVPGSKLWAKVDKNKVPKNAVLACAAVALTITLPALVEVNIGSADAPIVVPTAFYAVTSITVIGLYLAFLVPIYQRLRMGDKFKTGSWNLGSKYKWMAPIAIAEIVIICIYFIMPTTPMGWPTSDSFDIKFVNYAPVLVGGSMLLLWIWWHLSVKKWFTGPKSTI